MMTYDGHEASHTLWHGPKTAPATFSTLPSTNRMGILDIVPAGVVSGKDVYKVFDYAREHHFAIPAFNVTVGTILWFLTLPDLVGRQRGHGGGP